MRQHPPIRPSRPFAWLIALLVAAWPLVAGAQTRPAGVPGHLFFWKVTSPKATVYLLGSVHLMRRDMYPLPVEVEEAFQKSDYLACEINLNTALQGNAVQEMMSKALYTDGRTLFDVLSRQDAAKLRKALAERNLPEFMFKTMKPWMAAAMLPTMDALADGYTETGVDQHFMNLAAGRKIPIREVESVESQLDALADMPEDMQIKWLESQLVPPAEVKEAMAALTASWSTGDQRALSKVATEDMSSQPALEKRLVLDRNDHMTRVVEGYLTQPGIGFVVVGAAHLTGKSGVVAQLRAKGYPVVLLPVTLRSRAALAAVAALQAESRPAATSPGPRPQAPEHAVPAGPSGR